MTRLTDPLSDDDIDDLRRDNCHGSGDAYACAWEVHSMAAELRARRAADLSAEDVEELRAFKVGMNYEGLHDDHQGMRVICRLLAAAGGAK